jgi:hypothetical protein
MPGACELVFRTATWQYSIGHYGVSGIMGALTVLGASSGFGAFSYMLTVDLGYLFYASVVLLAVAISCLTMHESQLPISPENAKCVLIP